MRRRVRLLEQLTAYRPADDLESRHHAALVDLLSLPGDIFTRGHFTPGHVTASCFILDPDGERLLLHHHKRLNRWLQMGGHVEGDEQPVEAALREGREESGLDDLELVVDEIFDLDVHGIPAAKGEPDHAHYDVRFLACTRAPERIVIDAEESNALQWVPFAEAEALMDEEASSRVLRKIERRMNERRLPWRR